MFYVLYDELDNIIGYYSNLLEFCVHFNYAVRELRRKFKLSHYNYINLIIDRKCYKLYEFK